VQAANVRTRPPRVTQALGRHTDIMSDTFSIEGPVELVGGELMLRIPLDAGGAKLAPLAGKIGKVQDDCLCIVIQPWLAEKLRVGAGSLVVVDNQNGKFTITRSPENDREAL